MELNYKMNGDYLFPEITVSDPICFIGKYGVMYKEYLKHNHPGQYNRLILSGHYTETLCRINDQAQERMNLIVQQMSETEQITEKLKAQNPMMWVQKMNNIRNCAKEIVLREIIYSQEEN